MQQQEDNRHEESPPLITFNEPTTVSRRCRAPREDIGIHYPTGIGEAKRKLGEQVLKTVELQAKFAKGKIFVYPHFT